MTNKPIIITAAACPFCRGKIVDDLIQFGGNCPHCLLEIPGEEAPTDPGLMARKKLEAEALVQARSRRNRRAALGVVVVLMLSVGGSYAAWNAQQQKAARTYELPDDLYLPPLQEASAPGVAPTPTASYTAPTKRPTAQTGTGLGALGTNGLPGFGDMPVIPDSVLNSTSPLPTTAAIAPPPTSSGPRHASAAPTADTKVAMAGTGDMTVDIVDAPHVTLGDKPLSDDDEIFAMIKEVMNRYQPQVRSCYESRLKLNENLAGAWKVSFVVRKDGSTATVAVSPEGRKDAELEACIAKTIVGWRFSRIAHEQPVSQTKRFGAAF